MNNERPHHIQSEPTERGMVHRCLVCGDVSYDLAPTLPCPGPSEES